MSTVHNTGRRLVAWVKAHTLILVGMGVTMAFVAVVAVSTVRFYDERQARLTAVEELADKNRRLAEANVEQDRQQCEGINDGNETLRFLLDGAIRGRTPASPPLTDAQRKLTVDTYRRLPNTDCATGAKTYFDPPFPKENP